MSLAECPAAAESCSCCVLHARCVGVGMGWIQLCRMSRCA